MSANALARVHDVLWWLAVLMMALFAIFSPVTAEWLSRLEGDSYPVVTPATITRIEPAGDNYTRIWGHARKLRDCPAFLRIQWDTVSAIGASRSQVYFEDRATVRPTGDFSFGPWVVHMTPEQLGRSRAYVYHQCHPGWPTRSLFWGSAS